MVSDEDKKKNKDEDSILEPNKDSLDKEPEGPLKDEDKGEPNLESSEKKLIEDYKDKFLRSQAEFQNYQKRMEREFADYKTYSNSKLLEDLLVVVDDFQNALTAACEEKDKEYFKGFEMIFKNLLDLLKKEGLSEIPAQNEKFDPWIHEAVDMVPTDEHPDHTIIGVVQKGYKFKDKVLRPAKVQVTTNPKENICINEDKENEVKDED